MAVWSVYIVNIYCFYYVESLLEKHFLLSNYKNVYLFFSSCTYKGVLFQFLTIWVVFQSCDILAQVLLFPHDCLQKAVLPLWPEAVLIKSSCPQ